MNIDEVHGLIIKILNHVENHEPIWESTTIVQK